MLYNFWPSTWNILTQTVFEWDGHRLSLPPSKLKCHESNKAGLAVKLLKQSDVNYEKLFFVRLAVFKQLESCCSRSCSQQFRDQNSRDANGGNRGVSIFSLAVFRRCRELVR